MTKCIYIDTIYATQNTHPSKEKKTSITVRGVNRKREVLWECVVPIYYKIITTHPNQYQLSTKRNVLPKCVTPLQF